MKTVFRCPTAEIGCPYCDADCYCSLENPIENCDDAAACADDDCVVLYAKFEGEEI